MKRVVVSSKTVENIAFGFDNDRTQFLCCEIWPPLPRPINKTSARFCPNSWPFVLVFKIFSAAIVNTFITSNFLHKFLQMTTKWLLLHRPFLPSNTRALNRGREPEILWDAFRSQIAKLWFPYDRTMAIDRRGSQTIAGDRTWFYLLRSSAITIAGSQTIAEVCFHMIADDRRPYCDLRSAIRDQMETSLYVLSSAIVCDRLRSWSQDRRRSQKYVSIWSQTIADDRRPYCDLRSAIRDHMETSLYSCQKPLKTQS